MSLANSPYDENDPDYTYSSENDSRDFVENPVSRAEVERILRKIQGRQNAAQVIRAQADAMIADEEAAIRKLLYFNNRMLENYLNAELEKANKGKKKPSVTVKTFFGNLTLKTTGGRPKVENVDEVLSWLKREGNEALYSECVTEKVDTRGVIGYFRATGEEVPGVIVTEKSRYPAIAFDRKTGLKTIPLYGKIDDIDEEEEDA